MVACTVTTPTLAGFLADLVEHNIKLEELREGGTLILGAGGSARAVAYALASSGVPVHILARRRDQAQGLIDQLLPHLPASSPPHVLASPFTNLPDLTPDARLIINCTPLGMTPHIDASPWPDNLPFRPGQIVYDLVYNPPETRLIQQAQADGACAVNGLGMLLHQGALAWQLWTGQPAPLDAMRAALSF